MQKCVIISGGSKGLGAALYETYLGQGWQVYELSRSAPHTRSLACDFSQLGQAQGIIETLLSKLAQTQWGEIQVIHNVGRLGTVGPVANIHDWQTSIDVNFGSLVLITQLFARYFQADPARKYLAAISSGAAQRDMQGWSLYCATKAAMDRFIGCFALEQAAEDSPIRALILNPGVMDTQMQAQIRESDPADFPALQQFLDLKAQGQLPAPAEIAAKIYQLLQSEPQNGKNYRVADQ